MYACLNMGEPKTVLLPWTIRQSGLGSNILCKTVKMPRSIDNTHIYTFSSSDNWTLWTPESTRKGVFFQCFSIKAKEVKLSMYVIVRINQGGSCLMFPDAPEPGKREHLTFVNDKLCWRILFFSPENRSLMELLNGDFKRWGFER